MQLEEVEVIYMDKSERTSHIAVKFGGFVSISVEIKVSGFKFGRRIEHQVCNEKCGHI